MRLSWVLGLVRLGIETWLVEQIAPEVCRDERGRSVSVERSLNRRWFERVVEDFGLSDRAALVTPDGHSIAGASSEAVRDAAAAAELLVNISGNLTCEQLVSLPRRRAYLDLDPGYTHFWHAAGVLGPDLERHDAFLTVGLAIGRPACTIPTSGIRWRPVPPPVVLDEWPAADGGTAFTTVASWRGGYGRIEHEGRAYGQKAHEFRRFADVPRRIATPFEAALDIHRGDQADRNRLAAGGWRLVNPREVAGNPRDFRRYVEQSAAEFSPAQGIYVETASGWFGDRTTRYLASGKPAVVQETGFPSEIPRGEGLLPFRTFDEAVAGARAVLHDYDRHASAAREIAETLFASDVVLGAVLEDLIP